MKKITTTLEIDLKEKTKKASIRIFEENENLSSLIDKSFGCYLIPFKKNMSLLPPEISLIKRSDVLGCSFPEEEIDLEIITEKKVGIKGLEYLLVSIYRLNILLMWKKELTKEKSNASIY